MVIYDQRIGWVLTEHKSPTEAEGTWDKGIRQSLKKVRLPEESSVQDQGSFLSIVLGAY